MAPEQVLVQHKKVLQQTVKELNEFEWLCFVEVTMKQICLTIRKLKTKIVS